MARLSKLSKEFNVGLTTLVDFLNSIGANIESLDPNTKISDDYLPKVAEKFGQEQKIKQESDKKMEELAITKDNMMGSSANAKKKPVPVETEEENSAEELIIKTNVISAQSKGTDNVHTDNSTPSYGQTDEEMVKESVKTDDIAKAEKTAGNDAPVKADEEESQPVKHVETPEDTAPKMSTETAAETVAEPTAEPAEKTVSVEENVKPEKAVDTDTAQKDTDAVQNSTIDDAPKCTEADTFEKPQSGNAETTAPTPAEVKKTPVLEGDGIRLKGPVFTGEKIDLSQFDKKKKGKRERIKSSKGEKVDVTKVANDNRNGGDKRNGANGNNGGNGNKHNNGNFPSDRKSRKERRNEKFKPKTQEETEEMQKEIQKQIKETYARMNESKDKNKFGAKHRKDKRNAAADRLQEEMEQQEMEKKVLKLTEFVTVNDLATLMNNTPVTKVIGACMSLGLMVSINQRLDAETLVLVAEEFGYEVEFVTANITEAIQSEEEVDKEEDLVPRPPVITVMGHVDHGKTSLLDHIRNANVIAGEAGGITQHIGAYNVELANGRRITFLDTPGHEAFTAMRARGAKMTDLAIIIIAADDAIMPQTIEAISHAQAAGVPMVFAINKIDKPGANPDKIKEQLSNMNILVEDWGGKYQCQEISAKKGTNVDLLLDKVLLEADMLDLKANPNRRATGAVIESSLDKGRGYLATVLVQNGSMKVGDIMLSGCYTGRIKAMFNERGQKVDIAGPSTPVSVLGLNGAPTAGETFNIMADEKEARDIANKREQLIRIQGIKTQKHMTLEEIGRRIAIGNFKELNIIVKGDVDGSVEALSDSLIKLSTEEVRVNVIHKAVGAISESDVLLAAASDAIIIGFQVRPSTGARKLAEKEEIDIRLYSVIYDAINEVKDGIEGMLAPEEKEEVTATAEVLETFKISKVGTIAGAIIREGKLQRTSKVRVIRDGIVIYTGELGSLKRFKDDVKEVVSGMDCGLNILNFNDIKVGDIVEAYQIVEIKRTL